MSTTFSYRDLTLGILIATGINKDVPQEEVNPIFLLDLGHKLQAIVIIDADKATNWALNRISNNLIAQSFEHDYKPREFFRKLFEQFSGETVQEKFDNFVISMINLEDSGVRLYETDDTDKVNFIRVK